MDVLLVAAGGRRFGFRLDDVDEVTPVVRITPLRGASDDVEGVVDRRGTLVPVVDGRRRLGLPPRPLRLSDRLVFLRTPGRAVAVRVDAAVGLVEVLPADLSAAASFAPEATRSIGVGRLGDGLLVVFDAATLMSSEDWSALGAALDGPEPEPDR